MRIMMMNPLNPVILALDSLIPRGGVSFGWTEFRLVRSTDLGLAKMGFAEMGFAEMRPAGMGILVLARTVLLYDP